MNFFDSFFEFLLEPLIHRDLDNCLANGYPTRFFRRHIPWSVLQRTHTYTTRHFWFLYFHRLSLVMVPVTLFTVFCKWCNILPVATLLSAYRLDPPLRLWLLLPVHPHIPLILANSSRIALTSCLVVLYGNVARYLYTEFQEALGLFRSTEAQLKRLKMVKPQVVRNLFPGMWGDGWHTGILFEHRFREPQVLPISLFDLAHFCPSEFCDFADAKNDLPSLIMGRRIFDGYELRFEAWERLMPPTDVMKYMPDPHDLLAFSKDGSVDPKQSLDRIPKAILPSFIRTLQTSIPVGTPVVLSFSTRGRCMTETRHFCLASAAFCPEAALYPMLQTPAIVPLRAVTPLYTTIHNITSLLASGNAPFHIQSIRNASQEYTETLDQREQKIKQLLSEPSVGPYCNEDGLIPSCQERFRLLWEAAVIRCELLTRWEVVVLRDG